MKTVNQVLVEVYPAQVKKFGAANVLRWVNAGTLPMTDEIKEAMNPTPKKVEKPVKATPMVAPSKPKDPPALVVEEAPKAQAPKKKPGKKKAKK